MQWSYIYFPTFAVVNKRDKAQKAAKKKVTAAAQKSDSIKIRLPAAVRRRPSPRHEQDTQSRTNSEGPNERDSITPPPRLHIDPGKVHDAVDALLGMGHPLVEGLFDVLRRKTAHMHAHNDPSERFWNQRASCHGSFMSGFVEAGKGTALVDIDEVPQPPSPPEDVTSRVLAGYIQNRQ